MAPLPFNLGLVQFLADHRTAFLTKFFLGATFFGGAECYILIATLIYVAWNKKLAIRLSVLVLVTMTINDVLKLAIGNPRPFTREGSWPWKWAVSGKSAAKLAAEYSTPSGHAMASSAFYSYLYARGRNRWVRAVSLVAIILIGVSRVYLGVHYAEDVLIGWVIGLSFALVFIRYDEALTALWSRLSRSLQVMATVAACLVLWMLVVALNGGQTAGQPRDVIYYAGFLTGIVLARPLELRRVNFDPGSSGVLIKILRYLLSVIMVLCTLLFLDQGFGLLADRSSLVWNLLEYLRFTAVGFVTIFVAPLIFTRFGWATSTLGEAD